MAEFAHLHLHTEFSLLDGMGRVSEYAARAKEIGVEHLAVTDHGVMYAAMDWFKTLTKEGLHPIVGMEAYLAEGRANNRERKSYHLLLLAENDRGYRNLLRLASKASLEGFYYRPRIDLEWLAEHSEGIIATSACLGGPVANNFLHGRPEKAREYAGKLAEIFGPDRFFIEVQDHGLPEQLSTNRDLIPLARSLNLPLVATNDVHYCNQIDASAQDLLVCVQTNATLSDPKRLKTESDQLFLKGPNEMERVFGELPEALSNTIRIAEMCTLDLGFTGYNLPKFPIPENQTNTDYLARLVREGAQRKYGRDDGDIGDRVRYELGVIDSMGFTDYFLVVWDFVRFARENGILVGPGRGSAAGSIVTYCLDITALDPLKYDLIFERFLNPSRISMPDIDIDFADDRRDEVIAYVVDKYGADKVAQIITFGTLAAKASVRDCGRAMGWAVSEVDRVAKLIPVGPGITIDSALSKVPELHALYDQDPRVRELIDVARKVEGVARHSSTHAAGVVISRDPLVDHVPLQRAGGKSEGEVTTQFPMGQLEELGLLKMDFLGLSTLTIIGKAVELVRRRGSDLTIEAIPMDDPPAYELLRRGETVGIFQLEGGMTTRMTVDVAPESFEDLIALMALIRPGPMEMAPDYIARKHGRTPIEYMHPELEAILQETYGVALYQEQIIRIANVLAGFSMAEGDGLRKAMGKKLPAEMAKYRSRFVDGCVDHGLQSKLSGEIFDMIERFAGYGFNKAHSAAYAVIAAQTAYLKANHPVEFMAAILSTEIGNTEKVVSNIAECRRANIAVLPPSINVSDAEFSVEDTADEESVIRFGLTAVRNVGEGPVRAILSARADRPSGKFSDLEEFCEAVDWSAVNKRAVECLAKSGTFDGFGERHRVLAGLEQCIAAAQKRQKATARGQIGLFDLGSNESRAPRSHELPQVDAAPPDELLAWEKELLGVYISDHPLTAVLKQRPAPSVQIVNLPDRDTGAKITLIGMVTAVRRITTRASRTMAVTQFEDLTGTIELVLFPDCYEQHSSLLQEGQILEIGAKVDRRGDQLQLICESATDQLPEIQAPIERWRIVVSLPRSTDISDDLDVMYRLDTLIKEFHGDDELILRLPLAEGEKALRSRRRIDWSSSLREALTSAVGPDCVEAIVYEHRERESPRWAVSAR